MVVTSTAKPYTFTACCPTTPVMPLTNNQATTLICEENKRRHKAGHAREAFSKWSCRHAPSKRTTFLSSFECQLNCQPRLGPILFPSTLAANDMHVKRNQSHHISPHGVICTSCTRRSAEYCSSPTCQDSMRRVARWCVNLCH